MTGYYALDREGGYSVSKVEGLDGVAREDELLENWGDEEAVGNCVEGLRFGLCLLTGGKRGGDGGRQGEKSNLNLVEVMSLHRCAFREALTSTQVHG